MGPARRGRRRGLIVGAAVGSAAARRNAADNQAAAPEPVASQVDPITEITRLGQLKDQGLITQEEFDAKKKQLLGL